MPTKFHTLDFDRFPPSVANLPAALTINNITVYPSFRYKGGDAGSTIWKPWGYPQSELGLLYLQAGTAPTYNNGSPLLGKHDDSVLFNAGGYYQAKTKEMGDITTEDIVLELLINTQTSANTDGVLGKLSAAGDGYDLYVDNSMQFRFRLFNSGIGSVSINSALGLSQLTWYHVLLFINRDEGSTNGSQWYLNGVASGAGTDPTSINTTVTNTDSLVLGINTGNGGGISWRRPMAYSAMWKYPSWHQAGASGPAEWATIAKQRFYQLTGIYPQMARGTALPSGFTQATTAHLDKVENSGCRKIYFVGAGWPRSCSRLDKKGKLFKGYLSESSKQNKLKQSQDLSATWNSVALAGFTLNNAIGPDGTLVLDGMVGTAVDTQHGVTQAVELSAVPYVISCFARVGNKNWLYLSDNTVANAYCYFNLVGKIKGTMGAGCIAAYMEDWGGGLFRCAIVFTGTAAGHTIAIYAADTDGDNSYTGDGASVDINIGCAQCEIGSFPSSYIPTVAAAVTRNADVLTYTMNDGNVGRDKGTISYDMMAPDQDLQGASCHYHLNDGTDDNCIADSHNTAVDYGQLIINTAGVQQTIIEGSKDIFDGNKHSLRHTWRNNEARQYTDDALDGNPDSVCSIPVGLSSLTIGGWRTTGYELDGLISNFKIQNRATVKK